MTPLAHTAAYAKARAVLQREGRIVYKRMIRFYARSYTRAYFTRDCYSLAAQMDDGTIAAQLDVLRDVCGFIRRWEGRSEFDGRGWAMTRHMRVCLFGEIEELKRRRAVVADVRERSVVGLWGSLMGRAAE